MAVSLTHTFVSAVPDEGVAGEVGPNEWNDEHVLTMGSGKVLLRTSVGTGPAEEGDLTDFVLTAQIGSAVQAYSANLDLWAAETPGDYLTTADAATTYQPLDSDLTAIAGLSTVTYGRSLLTLANATALAAEVDSFFLTPTEGNAAYQPLDSDLTAIAALTTTAAGRSVLAITDPNADRVMAWDDSAGAFAPIAEADITTQVTPAAGMFVLIYDTGALKKVDWSDLPGSGGGITAVVDDTTPQLGGNLDLNTFTVGDASAADLTKLSQLTATSTELNFVDGVTSAIQTQINTKAPTASPTFTGTVTVPATNFTVGASLPFSDSAGTLTLQNVDALDATTEAAIEAAIDTLANLTSIQGHTVTLTGALVRSGAHSLTLTTTGATNVTLPTSGTVYASGGTDVAVADGGSGRSSHTAYAVICGGTTTTAAQQSIAGVGTSGQVLTSNGAGALPTFQAAAGGGWTMVMKTSDTSIANDVIENADPALQFSMAASTTYAIRIVVKLRSTAATDFKWGLSGPASPTEIYGGEVGVAIGAGQTFEAYPTGATKLGAADGAAALLIELTVENGANTGTFSFNWAQNTTGAGPTLVKAGSYIEYRTY